ncbi:WD repeat-containing protein 27 isoform X2 [Hyla sarda]|uniref:WD repeat-containing protein 27 isoform X2 n=1 Tax=Hyla sarda TaxID=327740 RepID=UPI0024C46D76|nr:WD repeat-containing protein 27 isoform X2 [Hyla sarda]
MRDMSTFEVLGSHSMVSEVRYSESTSPLSHVQLACTPQYCAFPLNGNELCIWNSARAQEQTLILKGHHQPITAVALKNDGRDSLACSASQDYIIIWNVHECTKASHQGLLPRGHVIGTLLGTVQHLSLHPKKQLVAACANTRVFILNAEREEILTELVVHLGPVTAAEFWLDNFLICISEDRTFSVWNYFSQNLIYQSGIISVFPLLKMYIDEEYKQLITGCADGMLRIFSLAEEHHFRSISHINLKNEKHKFVEKSARNGKPDLKSSAKDRSSEDVVDSGLLVLHIQKCAQLNQEQDVPLLGNSVFLWVGSSTDLLLVNIANSEVEGVLHFEDYPNLSIQLAGSVSISSKSGENDICLIASMFGCKISLLTFDTQAFLQLQNHELQNIGPGTNLSIVSSDPLSLTSCLRCELPKTKDKQKANGPQTKVKDQPLVFHNKIKSSGYTTAPRMKMFSPKTNIKTSQVSRVKEVISSGAKKEYPLDVQAPCTLHKQITLSNKPTSACSIQYSGDGMKLACGLADRSLLVFSSTFIGEPAVFTGHDAAVNGFGWSYDRKWLVSTADDRTVRIWNVKNAASALVLQKEMFSRPARFPQFYYMDRFILLSSGAEIQLMRYKLDDCKDELNRYKQNSVCKPVQTLRMDSAVEITGLSAVNDFYSYIVLAAGSNRDVEIFDLNIGTRIATIPDVHPRAAHQICQNKGSSFSTQPAEAYNLFVTMAIGDCLKLWDIRTLRCVRRFEGHVNRYQSCGVAVSPCGRFIACGSEDTCAYIYETRSSTYLHKIPEHSESVINVAFNPSSPQYTHGTHFKIYKSIEGENGGKVPRSTLARQREKDYTDSSLVNHMYFGWKATDICSLK